MNLISDFLKIFNNQQKAVFASIVFLSFINSLLEVATFSALYPLVGSVVNKSFSEKIINFIPIEYIKFYFIRLEHNSLIFNFLLIFLFIFTLRYFFFIFINYYKFSFVKNFKLDLEKKLLDSFFYNYQKNIYKNSAEFIKAVKYNVSSVGNNVLEKVIEIFIHSFTVFGLIFFLFFLQFKIILITGIFFFIIYFSLIKMIKKKVNIASHIRYYHQSELIKNIQQVFSFKPEIILYDKEEFFKSLVKFSSSKYYNSEEKISILTSLIKPSIELIFVTIFFIIFIFFIYTIKDNQNLNELIIFLGIFTAVSIKIMPSFVSIFNAIMEIKVNKHAIVDTKHNLEDIKVQLNSYKKKIIYPFKKSLEFQNVYFKYEDSEDWTLKNINFKINFGDKILLKGISGSGKTTLVQLISGLIKPNKGKIIIDDQIDIAKNKNYILQSSILGQEVFIINDSIKKNISLSKDNVDEILLKKAIKLSALDNYLLSQKDINNYYLTENGKNISGGQKQRIGIARAFYFKKNLIIFDEPFSALDKETEKKILNDKFFSEYNKNFTIIIISHKFHENIIFDQIYEIKNGEIFIQ